LRGNKIDDKPVLAISEAVKQNKSLVALDLFHNSIGILGAQALANALRKNNSLTSLCLAKNRIGDDGAQALAKVCDSDSHSLVLDHFIES
jgi:hypothetical protein